MVRQILFVFGFEGRTQRQITKANRDLFGYVDIQKGGKYIYEREGLLSGFINEKVNKASFLTDERNDAKIFEILKKAGCKTIERYYITLEKVKRD